MASAISVTLNDLKAALTGESVPIDRLARPSRGSSATVARVPA